MIHCPFDACVPVAETILVGGSGGVRGFKNRGDNSGTVTTGERAKMIDVVLGELRRSTRDHGEAGSSGDTV